MRIKSLLFFIGIAVALSSCVLNKKYLYLQKNDLRKNRHPIDTAVRDYTIEPFIYKIQTNDILSVRYSSLTEEEYNISQTGSGGSPSGGGSAGGTSSGNAGSSVNALLIGDIVDDHGEIPIPVIGKLKVAGLTVFQVQDTLQKIANRYLDAPIVRVRLLNYRATILGAVNMEGHIVFNNNRVTMMEAIGMAGGLSELADRSKVKIVRQNGSKLEVYYVNLLDENFINSPLYYIHQNDIIVVPPLRQRPFRLYGGQNLSLLLSSISLLILIITLSKK